MSLKFCVCVQFHVIRIIRYVVDARKEGCAVGDEAIGEEEGSDI